MENSMGNNHLVQVQMEGMPKAKRPTRYHVDVEKYVKDALLPTVISWMGKGIIDLNSEKALEIWEDLKEAIAYEDDGYRIARNLEAWNPDEELVDILSEVSFLKRGAHDAVVMQWVIDNDIQPDRKIGDQVSYTEEGKVRSGNIVKIYERTAKYVVSFPELGHVPSEQQGTQGLVLDYEEVHDPVVPVEPGIKKEEL
jgi:hypothetical protein